MCNEQGEVLVGNVRGSANRCVRTLVPAWASGRASVQERWGLPSDRVTVLLVKKV